ncbi:MAG: hypothetical protein BroJett025_06260 [Patescibacteria group bacterium]|nr:MAG: hypothetical protein BroJett025_06260 [Patescibacteria group bacterium]
MDIQVNFLVVVLAAVASMVVGFLWYGPIFGKQWMKLMGYTQKSLEKAKQEMSKTYAISFVGSLVMAYVLTHVTKMSVEVFSYPMLIAGLLSALWMWLGFVAPVQMTEVLFGGKKWSLYFINTGYQLAAMLAMGIVIGLFA